MKIQFIPNSSDIGDEISYALECGRYAHFRVAVAYARDTGVVALEKSLQKFVNAGGNTALIVGIDQKITSYQSLVNLLPFTNGGSDLYIHHTTQLNETYHPKMYIFGGENPIEKIIVGSSNMTRGGFYTNIEANIGIDFADSTLANANAKQFKTDVERFWNNLLADSNTLQVTKPNQGGLDFLNQLLANNFLENEANRVAYQKAVSQALGKGGSQVKPNFFGKTNKKQRRGLPSRPVSGTVSSQIQMPQSQPQSFLMTLSNFDTSSKSLDPVILIPLLALRANKGFWSFPELYTLSEGKYPHHYVNLLVEPEAGSSEKTTARIYFYAEKSEFRFQCEYAKRNGKPGDIMHLTKTLDGYEVRLIKKATSEYGAMRKKLTTRASASKWFGYF